MTDQEKQLAGRIEELDRKNRSLFADNAALREDAQKRRAEELQRRETRRAVRDGIDDAVKLIYLAGGMWLLYELIALAGRL